MNINVKDCVAKLRYGREGGGDAAKLLNLSVCFLT